MVTNKNAGAAEAQERGAAGQGLPDTNVHVRRKASTLHLSLGLHNKHVSCMISLLTADVTRRGACIAQVYSESTVCWCLFEAFVSLFLHLASQVCVPVLECTARAASKTTCTPSTPNNCMALRGKPHAVQGAPRPHSAWAFNKVPDMLKHPAFQLLNTGANPMPRDKVTPDTPWALDHIPSPDQPWAYSLTPLHEAVTLLPFIGKERGGPIETFIHHALTVTDVTVRGRLPTCFHCLHMMFY